MHISNLADVKIGEFVHKNFQSDIEQYPVYNGGITNTGFYKDYNREENQVIISARGANAGFVNRVFSKFWSGNSCYTLEINNKLLDWNYLYYWLKNNENLIIGEQQRAGIPAVSKRQIEDLNIKLPSIKIQQQIVSTLEIFDDVVNNLKSGLPAEIEARKKQYEYYRDKLLSFGESDE